MADIQRTVEIVFEGVDNVGSTISARSERALITFRHSVTISRATVGGPCRRRSEGGSGIGRACGWRHCFRLCEVGRVRMRR